MLQCTPDRALHAISINMRVTAPDPIRPLGLLQSGRTLRRRTCEFRIYEAAIRGLVQSATCCRW